MKKCKECGREEWGFLSVLNEDGYCPICASSHYEEKIKRLQEQLKEANEIISDLSEYPPINPSTRELSNALNRYNAKDYLEKWGVK